MPDPFRITEYGIIPGSLYRKIDDPMELDRPMPTLVKVVSVDGGEIKYVDAANPQADGFLSTGQQFRSVYDPA